MTYENGDDMDLGTKLRKEREKRNWSQKYVAEKVGISSNAVLSHYERGVRDLNTKTLKKLARLYDVSSDYLIGLTDDPKGYDNDFFEAITDPSLKRWCEELVKDSKEDDLYKLRIMWDLINKK